MASETPLELTVSFKLTLPIGSTSGRADEDRQLFVHATGGIDLRRMRNVEKWANIFLEERGNILC